MNLRGIIQYSVASTKEAAFVLGGRAADHSTYYDVIAKFENDEWSHFGNLQQGRGYHGAITSGTETMIFGGYGSRSS